MTAVFEGLQKLEEVQPKRKKVTGQRVELRGGLRGMGVLSWWFAVVLCFLFTLRRGEILSLLQALTAMMLCLSSQSQVTMHRILLGFF